MKMNYSMLYKLRNFLCCLLPNHNVVPTFFEEETVMSKFPFIQYIPSSIIYFPCIYVYVFSLFNSDFVCKLSPLVVYYRWSVVTDNQKKMVDYIYISSIMRESIKLLSISQKPVPLQSIHTHTSVIEWMKERLFILFYVQSKLGFYESCASWIIVIRIMNSLKLIGVWRQKLCLYVWISCISGVILSKLEVTVKWNTSVIQLNYTVCHTVTCHVEMKTVFHTAVFCYQFQLPWTQLKFTLHINLFDLINLMSTSHTTFSQNPLKF
jgi:hypothetical protein